MNTICSPSSKPEKPYSRPKSTAVPTEIVGRSKATRASVMAFLATLAACGPREEPVPQLEELPQDCSDLDQPGALAPKVKIIACPTQESSTGSTTSTRTPLRPAPRCGARIVDGDADTGLLRIFFQLERFRACQGPVIISSVGSFTDGRTQDLNGMTIVSDKDGAADSVDTKLQFGISKIKLKVTARRGEDRYSAQSVEMRQ